MPFNLEDRARRALIERGFIPIFRPGQKPSFNRLIPFRFPPASAISGISSGRPSTTKIHAISTRSNTRKLPALAFG